MMWSISIIVVVLAEFGKRNFSSAAKNFTVENGASNVIRTIQ